MKTYKIVHSIKIICIFCLLLIVYSTSLQANPIKGLLERIDPGCSSKFIIEQKASDTDFFELDQKGDKVVIRGNNYVSIATGVNWYLKYHAGIHLSWNGMTATLPDVLPAVKQKERHETKMPYRYDFNYCTCSYTMAFWDWNRWEKEIDWMALHGINLPLTIVGTDAVWYNVLKELGYNKKEIGEFIAGPAFQGWWLMNNLEGWGGPNPDSWYTQQIDLQKKILKRMHEYGIDPVFPGYCGMLPHNAKEKLGLNVTDPLIWCGFQRPVILMADDPKFKDLAALYYREMEKLFGKANYYSMDPFHEGAFPKGVDHRALGQSIMAEMKKANPKAKWVLQSWGDHPHPDMIEGLDKGEVIIIDIFSESTPNWGDPDAPSPHAFRRNGFGKHEWLYSTVFNYGGNVGLHGKMGHVINSFYKVPTVPVLGENMKGLGLLQEGIENNPIMFELFLELPWRAKKPNKEEWVKEYTKARYGVDDKTIQDAWVILANSIYNAPAQNTQQGTNESIFCARPSLNAYQVSTWSGMKDYYDPNEVIKAARLMLSVADRFKGNNNFEYDLVDIVRQAIAEKGRMQLKTVRAAYNAGNTYLYKQLAEQFLDLILLQDELLSTRSEFKVGNWIAQARSKGFTTEEKDLYEWNARVQITTWGHRVAAEQGGLRDYSHREWSGVLRDVYYKRWKTFFDSEMDPKIDYYAMDEAWTKQTNPYSSSSSDECIETVQKIFNVVFD